MSCRRQAANPMISTPDMTIGEMMIACFVSPGKGVGRACSHTARNHPYRLSLELRLVSVVHRRIASAEHFLAGEPRTIVVV